MRPSQRGEHGEGRCAQNAEGRSPDVAVPIQVGFPPAQGLDVVLNGGKDRNEMQADLLVGPGGRPSE